MFVSSFFGGLHLYFLKVFYSIGALSFVPRFNLLSPSVVNRSVDLSWGLVLPLKRTKNPKR